MSEALRKNELALARAVGNAELGARLQSLRIGIWSEPTAMGASGNLIAEALGDVLGRLWRKLDVYGPIAETFVQAANLAASSGRQLDCAMHSWNPPYDFVIALGADVPTGVGPGLRVGATGWVAKVGSKAVVNNDPNPVGPATAAAIVAAELFKRLFADGLGTRATLLPPEFEWSVWDYGHGSSPPPVDTLYFDDVHVIGVGAVTHGMLWLLERWPSRATGLLHLIDQDSYDESNGQRYIGMHPEDVGRPKSEQAAERLRGRQPRLLVYPHDNDMNRYFIEKRPDCRVQLAVIGVDSPEHRRQLALKLPRRVVNMWTEGDRLGAARFGFTEGWPCLFCAYPEDTAEPMDETGLISKETGLKPHRVRELLFSGDGLEHSDVSVIASRHAMSDPQALVGKPLRTVRGVLCATGRLQLPETAVDVDVPFAFSSFLAGIGGFVELVRELWGAPSEPGHWQLPVLRYPVPGNWFGRGPSSGCYLCSDELIPRILADKYPTVPIARPIS